MDLFTCNIYKIEGETYRVTITDCFYEYLKSADKCYIDGDTSVHWSKFRKND